MRNLLPLVAGVLVALPVLALLLLAGILLIQPLATLLSPLL